MSMAIEGILIIERNHGASSRRHVSQLDTNVAIDVNAYQYPHTRPAKKQKKADMSLREHTKTHPKNGHEQHHNQRLVGYK